MKTTNIVTNKEITYKFTEGRLFEVWRRWVITRQSIDNSWCELFKTEGYRRQDEHANRIAEHGHKLIGRFLDTQTKYILCALTDSPNDPHRFKWKVTFDRGIENWKTPVAITVMVRLEEKV